MDEPDNAPTRSEAQRIFDGSIPEAEERELIRALIKVYVKGGLTTRQLLIENLDIELLPPDVTSAEFDTAYRELAERAEKESIL